MREHCCKSCDYCLEYFNGYDFEYYCLKWNEETNYYDICYKFYYKDN